MMPGIFTDDNGGPLTFCLSMGGLSEMEQHRIGSVVEVGCMAMMNHIVH